MIYATNDKYERSQLYNKYNYVKNTIIWQIEIYNKYNYTINIILQYVQKVIIIFISWIIEKI